MTGPSLADLRVRLAERHPCLFQPCPESFILADDWGFALHAAEAHANRLVELAVKLRRGQVPP
ncbi:MAG: hypothetical protein WB947_06885 [Thermoplasmata archaeon]